MLLGGNYQFNVFVANTFPVGENEVLVRVVFLSPPVGDQSILELPADEPIDPKLVIPYTYDIPNGGSIGFPMYRSDTELIIDIPAVDRVDVPVPYCVYGGPLCSYQTGSSDEAGEFAAFVPVLGVPIPPEELAAHKIEPAYGNGTSGLWTVTAHTKSN